MSEEQKKQVEGVLHEMKHMNPQQIEVVIALYAGHGCNGADCEGKEGGVTPPGAGT